LHNTATVAAALARQMSIQPKNKGKGRVHFVSVLHGAHVVYKNHMRSSVGKMQPDEHVHYVLYGLNVPASASSCK
jgi:hypothetical protein